MVAGPLRSLCSRRLPQARRDVTDPARSFYPFPELMGARRSAVAAWLRSVRGTRDWSSYCSVYLASLLSSWPSWSQRFVLDLSYPWHAALTLRTSPEFRRKSPVIWCGVPARGRVSHVENLCHSAIIVAAERCDGVPRLFAAFARPGGGTSSLRPPLSWTRGSASGSHLARPNSAAGRRPARSRSAGPALPPLPPRLLLMGLTRLEFRLNAIRQVRPGGGGTRWLVLAILVDHRSLGCQAGVEFPDG